MAQVIADRRDIDFVLYEQLKIDEMTSLDKYKDFNKKTFDMIITEARNFALKELLPTNAEGDKEGLGFENGQVKVPQCFHRAYELYVEGEWTSLTEDPEWGGQGLPTNISQAVGEYLIGGNWAVANYAGMGHGTGKMIEIFGTQTAKRPVFKKSIYRQMGRHHAVDRIPGRFGCRCVDDHCRQESRRHLFHHRQQNLYHQRRV